MADTNETTNHALTPKDTAQSPRTDADQHLLNALREFIKQEQIPTTAILPNLSTSDALWLFMIFACVFLSLYQIDRVWLSGDIPKLVVDKVLPWFLSFGAIATILKSPESVLKVTRNSPYRWIILPLVLLLFIGALLIFKVVPQVADDVKIYLDGNLQNNAFRVNFRVHDIELKSDNNQVASRRLQITRSDLLHGLELHPDWRLVYPAQLDIGDDDLLICFEPQHFTIDKTFRTEVGNKFRRVGPKALEYSAPSAGGFDLPLPVGLYHVIGFRHGCGVTRTVVLEVGPNAPISPPYLGRANCSNTLSLQTSPCDQLLSNERF